MKTYLIITAVISAFLILFPLALVGFTSQSDLQTVTVYETTEQDLVLTSVEI